MTERDSGPQVCKVLSVVIVSCKLCCLNAVSKRKTLPSLGIGPHACCGMFIATLQSRKLKLVTTCGLGASRQDRPTCGYNPPSSVCTLVTLNLIQVKTECFCCCNFDFLLLASYHLLNIGPSMLFCNQNWATISFGPFTFI